MKKGLSLFVIAMLILVLAACGKPGGSTDNTAPEQNTGEEKTESQAEATELEPEEGAELIVWGNADQEAEWTQYVAEKFTEEYGIPVTFEEVGHTDAPGKLQTDGPAGLGGDIFTGAHDHVGNMDAAGLIYENYYAEELQERFMDGAVTGVSANSEGEYKMFGYPLAIETVALYYNQDLLDEMGFEPAETMEELIQQSKEFMEKNKGSYGFMIEPGNYYLVHGFLGGYGGYIFGDNNTNPQDIGLNNEGGLKAAELMVQLREEILPLKKEDITGDVISSHFNEGKLLYYVSGPWAVKGHQEAGVNFGVKLMPTLENGEIPQTFSGVKALFVNAYSEYPKAATLFAKFSTSDEMLLKRYEMTGQLPPSNALLDNETIKADELNLAFLEQAQHSVSMPNIPAMQHVWAGMEVAFTAIWNGESDPKEALDKGVQQIKDAIATQTK
ncbi:maltose ABC transporter substrate-binding protein [Bacillus sp. PS06]|uniref:sugar ABC transporter substrate-binding protein n=1 Tax=Bacillus sp. PS06 TaxID=2764176 RepID=UPI00178759FA|nr:maltose ABC transporter substrate-binding protein [Bacillus sp. PS06]MBD8069544.1 maltose ABC transporter substrate-binding protein [Bacillus sp. PS06]